MKYSDNVTKTLTIAKERATDGEITPEHLIIGLILNDDCVGREMLEILIDMDDAQDRIKSLYEHEKKNTLVDEVNMTVKTKSILLKSQVEAIRAKKDEIRTEHLVLAIADSGVLEHLTRADAEEVLMLIQDNEDSEYNINDNNDIDMANTTSDKLSTPMLDKYTINLTDLAEKKLLDPVVGRSNELRRVAQVLSRRKKNNPVLIGPPGVGKTAIVDGLAQNIANKTTPDSLFGKKILSLDMGSLVAGTKYRGEFEERMEKIVKELKQTDDIVLYIDELHTIVGAGSSSGSLDAANILKPALSRGEISCIGSTTLDEYRKIEKDGALERRFQKIMVNEPSIDDTREILKNIKGQYEDHHNVTYSDEAIEACLNLSDRYVTDRNFPDKAIDAMDEAGSSVRINLEVPQTVLDLDEQISILKAQKEDHVGHGEFEIAAEVYEEQKKVQLELKDFYANRNKTVERKIVTAQDIAVVLSIMTGIPTNSISEDEIDKFINLEENLKHDIIGQDEAVSKITKSMLRNKAGLNDTKKPIGSFLFLGPTGVGKTYLAKKLAKHLFNSDEDMIRIDMSEYMEKHSVSRLVGAPPGYVGHEEGGQLTEVVRRNPYSIILLDEIEKAHSDVTNILLQIFEDGILTDSQGKTVNFKNTVIIMTSNVGSREAKARGNSVGFTDRTQQVSEGVVEKALKAKFSPEFLNRIDSIVKFEPLGKEEIKFIIDLEINKFILRLKENNLDMVIDDAAKEFLLEKGWDADLGARPLKRAIQTYIEDEISLKIIMKEFAKDSTINVTKHAEKDELVFSNNTKLLADIQEAVPTLA